MRKITITLLGKLQVHNGSTDHQIRCPYGHSCDIFCAWYSEKIEEHTIEGLPVEKKVVRCKDHIIGELA